MIALFKQDNAINKCYVWIKKIMPNLLYNKLGCRYLEHKKKHAPKGEGRGGGGSEIYLKKIGGAGA